MNKFGLTTEEASKALSEQGNNALTQPPRETFWDKLWENFKDPIIRILILALLVNVVFVYMGHGDWIETMGIFLAIILATARKPIILSLRPILPGAMVLSIFWTSISCSAAASLSKVRASCRPLRSATALSTVS